MIKIEDFKDFMNSQEKSLNTIKAYSESVEKYIKWFKESFSIDFTRLHRENILDYKSFLLNIQGLDGASVNPKIAALIKFNEYLIDGKYQENYVVTKKDYVKIQKEEKSPNNVYEKEVEEFRQKILENESKRNYSIVTLLAYSGMRISEAINIKMNDLNLAAQEVLVRSNTSKGKKQRLVIINDKIINAIKSYLEERENSSKKDSEYLFVSRESGKLDKTVVNRVFNRYSDKITPHSLRHFFCYWALQKGWTYREVAEQVGHSDLRTTMIYTMPSRDEMKKKANLL